MKQISYTSPPGPARWRLRRALLCAGAMLAACVAPFSVSQAAVADPVLQPRQTEGITPVVRIRSASREVYRIFVEVDGAVKGGTAFLVSGHRIIVTNHHVIENGTAIYVGFSDANGRVQKIPVNVVAKYPQKDLALLAALDDLPGQPLALSSQSPEAPTDLFAIGYPAAADPQGTIPPANPDDISFYVPSVLKGYVSRVLPNRWMATQLQHQTPIVPGYSGGPLLNDDGVVVGISTAIHKEANGISYGVLSSDLVELAAACSIAVRANPAQPRPTLVPQTLTPVPGPSNAQQTLAGAEFRAKLARADKLLTEGAVSAARLLCRHLIETTHSAEAYHCLGRTFDPAVLRDLGVLGMEGDEDVAKQYYEQAVKKRQESDAFIDISQNMSPAGDGTCENSLCRLVNMPSGQAVLCQRQRSN